MVFLDSLYFYKNLLLIFSCCVAYFISKLFFPAIIYLTKTKKLTDIPSSRSAHTKITPTLGGVGVFLAFVPIVIGFGIVMDVARADLIKLLSLLFGLVLLLFLGIKDDLVGLSPKKKLMSQIICSFFVVTMTDIRLQSLGGILGIGELPYIFSVILSVFVFIFIINAYNLIDGIDGLSGSIAIIVSTVFGFYFVFHHSYCLASVSFVLVGSILGFLEFNLSKIDKIFMGDSGSMFIGFLLAFQSLGALKIESVCISDYAFNNAHIVILAILAFPVFDTLRVFLIRVKSGKNPFTADRNHIHHKLIDFGMKHKNATAIICFVNLIIIVAVLYIDSIGLNVNLELLIVAVIIYGFYSIALHLLKFKSRIKLVFTKFKIA